MTSHEVILTSYEVISMPRKVNGAIGIDLNQKSYIVACLDSGEQLYSVEVECCVKFYNCLLARSQSIVRFRQYYDDILSSERINELLQYVVKELVGYAKRMNLIIVLEDLGFSKYISKSNFDKMIKCSRHGKFVYMLWKECNRKSIPLIFVSHDKTSLKCSKCGHYNTKRKFSKNKFKCERCGFIIDKDVNAAINIARKGLVIYLNDLSEVIVYK